MENTIMIVTLLCTIALIAMIVKALKFLFNIRPITARRLYIIGGTIAAINVFGDAGSFQVLLWCFLVFYVIYTFFATVVGGFIRAIGGALGGGGGQRSGFSRLINIAMGFFAMDTVLKQFKK